MVNALKKNCPPVPAGKYGKWTNSSTPRRHQANEGESALETETLRALGAMRRAQSKKKLAAKKSPERHFLSNEDKEQLIEDYVERETAGARKRHDDVEAAVQQELEYTRTAQNGGLTNGEPEKSFHEMMVAIRDSLSDLASSDDGEDGEDEDDEETE